MATGVSLIDPGDIGAINQLRRDAQATALALADPPISIVLVRRDPETGVATPLAAKEVVLRWDDRSAISEVGGEGGGSAPVTGQMKAFEPWNVQRNDRFALADGTTGTIEFVQPARGGVVRATFVADIGR